jgi:hypothetical protein
MALTSELYVGHIFLKFGILKIAFELYENHEFINNYQNGEKYTTMTTKYTKWPKHLPTSIMQDTPKFLKGPGSEPEIF